MNVLISMTDFVLEQSKIGMEVQSLSHQLQNRADRFEKIVKYAQFLKQPLTLGMFVPCDADGNVLEDIETGENLKFHPLTPGDEATEYWIDYKIRKKEYQEAKERVLFEGFELMPNHLNKTTLIHKEYKNFAIELWAKNCKYKTVECLIKNFSPVLTNTAKNKIGL